MTIQYLSLAVVATLLLGTPASAQSAADLLQQGIHAQETVGDLDGAIQIFRQVAASPSTNKALAAQAQYQLVLCLLQKGDRTGAAEEVRTLEAKFPDQQDLARKARQAIGGGETLLKAPWSEREIEQLNIERDGAFTGETLFYTVDPDLGDGFGIKPNPQAVYLAWELDTKATKRGVRLRVDRDSMQLLQVNNNPDVNLTFDDMIGDPGAAPLSGPAIDAEGSVFRMRRMPLAPGYKTALTSTPLTIGVTGPKKLDLEVTGIEAVQTSAGKFDCYKVVFGSIGQTFWFKADASRTLVRLKAGNVEAEYARMWLDEDITKPVAAAVQAAGGKVDGVLRPPIGRVADFSVSPPGLGGVQVEITKVFTSAAEVPEALQRAEGAEVERQEFVVRGNGIQTLMIGGQHALSLVAGRREHPDQTYYTVWIQTENTLARFEISGSWSIAVARWRLDQFLSTVRLP